MISILIHFVLKIYGTYCVRKHIRSSLFLWFIWHHCSMYIYIRQNRGLATTYKYAGNMIDQDQRSIILEQRESSGLHRLCTWPRQPLRRGTSLFILVKTHARAIFISWVSTILYLKCFLVLYKVHGSSRKDYSGIFPVASSISSFLCLSHLKLTASW